MGDYAYFRIGDLHVGRAREGLPPEALAVFTDSMVVQRRESARERYVEGIDDDDEVIEVTELVAPAATLRDRLDVIGVTRNDVIDNLRHALEFQQTMMREFLTQQDVRDEVREEYEARLRFYQGLDPESWVSLVRRDAHTLTGVSRFDRGAGAALDVIEYWEWRHLLRLMCEVFPEETVTLDVTELDITDFEVADLDGKEPQGDLWRTVPSASMTTLRQSAAEHAPVVVLTEGRTDSEFLAASLRLLRPQLADMFSFYDYELRVGGGAPAVVNTVKAFAAAGISNRTIALLDNDSAAHDAARGIANLPLPPNICVLYLPDLDIAKSYPTLGPPTHEHPTGALALADVNGLAGSIELYLGRDVLTSVESPITLEPVKWSSYLPGVNAYQGEVMHKGAIHERFRAKVASATEQGLAGREDDWIEMSTLLDQIVAAAVAMASAVECFHGGGTEMSLTPRWGDGGRIYR